MSTRAVRFKTTEVPRQTGEQARLKVVHGPDRGFTFVIRSDQASVGRGEECDVHLSDIKSSRKHFELQNKGDGSWALKDLGSSNGVLIKGTPVRSALIRSGEILTLGETVLEFLSADVGTRVMMTPARSIEQIRQDQQALQAQRERVLRLGKSAGQAKPMNVPPASLSTGAPKKKNPGLLIILAALIAIWSFISEDSPVKKRLNKKDPRADKIPTVVLPPDQLALVKSQVDPLVKLGIREYQNGNLLRARQHFDEILRLQPDHAVAIRYLNNCTVELDKIILDYMRSGRRQLDAGKLREARSSFQSVINLLDAEPSHDRYKQAQEFIEQIAKIQSGDLTIGDVPRLAPEKMDGNRQPGGSP
jgi:pSer/pThr/pTyr-binding forkhead associated (FHA) protein